MKTKANGKKMSKALKKGLKAREKDMKGKKPGTGVRSATIPLSKMTPEQKKKLNKRIGSPAKMAKKSPAKKPLVGKQNNLPKELKDKILASPAKMKKAAMKMKKESMAMLKKSAMMMKKASAMKMKMKKK